MIYTLSKDEKEEMDRDVVIWVEKTLKGDYGTYLYNILNQLRLMIKNIQNEK